MSIWTRIADALSALTSGESLSVVFDRLRTPPERSVAFAIAVIGLGAKMAKADGLVTRDEVTAFREVFFIPEGRGSERGAGLQPRPAGRGGVRGLRPPHRAHVRRGRPGALRPHGGALPHRGG
jgi:hypothetical protein